jgi:putative ABC transport system permease protein
LIYSVFQKNTTMFKTYFKLAYRNITKDKAYSTINILGLAIGLASSILILLWVQNELSYDKFHENAGQIYRIACDCGDSKTVGYPGRYARGLEGRNAGY